MHQEQITAGQIQRSAREGDAAHVRVHPSFRAVDHVLGNIERIVLERRDACIETRAGRIWVRPETRSYHAELEDSASLLAIPSPQVSIGTRMPDAPTVWRPLEELLWQAAFHASAGRLLDRCSPFDVVQFAHWPNFTRLPHNSSAMRLTALLVRAPITISLAYRLLHIPAQDAFQIYSAGAAAGIARVVSPAPVEHEATQARPASASGRVSGFWQKMLDRFSGL